MSHAPRLKVSAGQRRSDTLLPPTTLCGVGPRASLALVVIAFVIVSRALIEARVVRFEARAVHHQLETLARRLDATAVVAAAATARAVTTPRDSSPAAVVVAVETQSTQGERETKQSTSTPP